MFTKSARLLLIATSLAPMLGAVGISEASRTHEPWVWVPWIATAVGLAVLCWALLTHAGRSLPLQRYEVTDIERNDQEALTFLLTYLLPFVASGRPQLTDDWLTGAYVLFVIFLVTAHAGALHFNPVMALFGYHFYASKRHGAAPHLLISRRPIEPAAVPMDVVKVAPGIYLTVK